MPIERRTVTTTTTRRQTVGADALKRNISNVADELAKVRDRAREEVGALEKIRGMLDVGYLTNLLQSVEELEERLETLESEALQANGEADRIRGDLDAEQARLEKLWNAYKSQEDELQRLKRDYPLMEEKLFERERTIETLRRDLGRLEGLEKYKAESERANNENAELQRELSHMDEELKRAAQAIHELEDEAESLRAIAPSKHRVSELEAQIQEERERLAKLYKVYEDLEAEKDESSNKLRAWEEWYRRLAPAFQDVGEAPRTAPAKSI